MMKVHFSTTALPPTVLLRFVVTVALLILLPTTVVVVVEAVSPVYELHGSGTSNPSKCYWSIMETLKEQADIPLHLTYRAVGSTQGIAEFTAMFNNNTNNIVSKFGSGDIPLKSTDYVKTTTDGTATGISQMYHLPVLIGAISFFHSLPLVDFFDDLKLNACILSQIYQLQITKWGDPAIIELNPTLPTSVRDLPIIVARRAEGSSSTYSSAEWMNENCDNDDQRLPVELVDNKPEWEKSDQTRDDCSKSAGMTACIQKEVGVIGYLDAGHGQSAGLNEVLLQVKGEYTKSSLELIQSAVVLTSLPSSPDADFGAVSFVTNGQNGWPIVNLTYLFVRKNIPSYIADPTEQALLIAFLRAIYNDEYVQQCADKYGFVIPGESIRTYATQAIDALVANSDGTGGAVAEFFYEMDDITIEAANRRNVFSTHRAEIADIEREALIDDVADINALLGSTSDNGDVLAQLAKLQKEVTALTMMNAALESQVAAKTGSAFGSKQESNLNAALILSVLSFLLWVASIVAFLFRRASGGVITSRSHHDGDLELKASHNKNNGNFVEDETTRI